VGSHLPTHCHDYDEHFDFELNYDYDYMSNIGGDFFQNAAGDEARIARGGTVILMSLLSFSVEMTVSPTARWEAVVVRGGQATKVRKTPSWPRSWANFSLL
jgi:hypothetical protein